MMNAYSAMAAAWQAMCAIPVVGPALGVAAGAAAFAGVSAIAKNIRSASGGYDIPAGTNPITQLHAEEMVLPAKYANAIRDMTNGGSGGGGSSGDVHVHINAVDAHSVKRLFNDHGAVLASVLKRQAGKFAI